MSAAWGLYDWVSAAEDPERYVLRILLNEFCFPGPAEVAVVASPPFERPDRRQRAVAVLRYWAGFSDGRVADLLICRRATVRSLAASAV